MRTRRLIGPDRFGVLLGLVLALFISVPIIQERRAGFVAMAAIATLMVVVTLGQSRPDRRSIDAVE